MIVLLGTTLLLVLLTAGVPVALCLGIAGAVGLYAFGGLPIMLGILGTAPASAIDAYEFLTIPMFLLMAEFMIVSGISSTLFNSIATWIGRVPGGLGVATALTGAAFGAISGSSTAAAATLSTTSVPSMVRHGYDIRFASGIASISGTLAMLIPPSIAIIFYGLLSGTSVAQLLIAGILPGALVALVVIMTIWIMIWSDPTLAPERSSSTMVEKLRSLRVAGPFAALFLLVTGLIYLGVATPVEASALGALGAMVFAMMAGRLTLSSMFQSLINAAVTSAMIGLIVVCAQIFGYFVTVTQVTQNLVTFVSGLGLPTHVVLGFIVLLYLVLGCFLDQISILILTIPIVLPVVLSLGYDPIWFGILVILIAEVGMVTPPVGLNVFIVAKKTNQSAEAVFAGVWPHVAAHILLILILIAFPQIILWLPETMTR